MLPTLILGALMALIVMARQQLHDGTQRITLQSKAKPTYAGVDPYDYYVDRKSDDNVRSVTAL